MSPVSDACTRAAQWWSRRFGHVVDEDEIQAAKDRAARVAAGGPRAGGAGGSDHSCGRCAPIKAVSQLLEWRPTGPPAADPRASRVPLLLPPQPEPPRPKLLVCHDMRGGYGNDAAIDRLWLDEEGCLQEFRIWHWGAIDTFVYFSHYLVTIPTRGWIEAAHTQGTKCLGTLITEFRLGSKRCAALFGSHEAALAAAEQLVALALHYGFDGWLINIENPLPPRQLRNLKHFLGHLRARLHAAVPHGEVIWYDAVTNKGRLTWQNALTPLNEPFFDLCDGIFTNYAWKRHTPRESARAAGGRATDVYFGIDVFGRGTYGGGGNGVPKALAAIRASGASAALFAPGWTLECHPPAEYECIQDVWWRGVERAWGRQRDVPCRLPVLTSFNCGFGRALYAAGAISDPRPWLHLSSTQLLPSRQGVQQKGKTCLIMQVTTEVAYEGGSCVAVVLAPWWTAASTVADEQWRRPAPPEPAEPGAGAHAVAPAAAPAVEPPPPQALRLFRWRLALPPPDRMRRGLRVRFVVWDLSGAAGIAGLHLHLVMGGLVPDRAAAGAAAAAGVFGRRGSGGGSSSSTDGGGLREWPEEEGDDGGGSSSFVGLAIPGSRAGGPAFATPAAVAAAAPEGAACAALVEGAPTAAAAAPTGAAVAAVAAAGADGDGPRWRAYEWTVPPEALAGAEALGGVSLVMAAAPDCGGWSLALVPGSRYQNAMSFIGQLSIEALS